MDSLKAWAETGRPELEFWSLQPWQTNFVIAAASRARTKQAHMAAALFGAAMAGKLQNVDAYLSEDKERAPQSAEEVMDAADKFFAAHEKRMKADG